jgi:hypothetical protein
MADNQRNDDWDIRGGGAVAQLMMSKFRRRPQVPFAEPGLPLNFDGVPSPIGRGGSNRRTRPSSPPRFGPRYIKMRR